MEAALADRPQMTGRNRIGLYSLVAAAVGFLFVTFQPWLPLEHVVLFRRLSLRSLLTAFFDASLVGALADWFAVSALFRHPIRVPLPHTNILARNREAIAEAVPRFLGSFIKEETIAAELGAVDFAGKVEAVLAKAVVRTEIIEFLRARFMALLAAASAPEGRGPSESFTMMVREIAMFAAERVDPAAVVGSFIQWGMREGLDEPVISAAVSAAGTALQRHLDDRGNLEKSLTPKLDSSQPGKTQYWTCTFSRMSTSWGNSVNRLPSYSYATPTGISARLSGIFEFGDDERLKVIQTGGIAGRRHVNQPQRRGRPVTAPYSPPRSRIFSPSGPLASVGKGPLPTRVA